MIKGETPQARYVVIFISQLGEETTGYSEAAAQMVTMVERQPGFLGLDSVRGGDGRGITVSYWESLEAIAAWREVPQHRQAQQRGREEWYSHYTVHVARLERSSRCGGL